MSLRAESRVVTKPVILRVEEVPRRVAARSWRRQVVVLWLVLVLALVTFGPLVYTVDPLEQRLPARLAAPGVTRADHFFPLGADALGRDILSRILHGARISLFIGGLSMLSGLVVGVALGVSAGYFGGQIDNAIMRVVDAQMSIPFLLFALILSSIVGPGIFNTVLALAFSAWITYARIVRAEALKLRGFEFVLAARSLGGSHVRIVMRHIMPNLANTLIAVAPLEIGRMILAEAALGFLGVGVPPPEASLGRMVADGQAYLFNAWWIAAIPGVAIMVIVLVVILNGEALRERLDPYARQQGRAR